MSECVCVCQRTHWSLTHIARCNYYSPPGGATHISRCLGGKHISIFPPANWKVQNLCPTETAELFSLCILPSNCVYTHTLTQHMYTNIRSLVHSVLYPITLLPKQFRDTCAQFFIHHQKFAVLKMLGKKAPKHNNPPQIKNIFTHSCVRRVLCSYGILAATK